MGNPSKKDSKLVSDRNHGESHGRTSLAMPQQGVFNYELFARMLSTSEDVGRRAINVAHVGDTRAYLAMRLMVANEEISSSSVVPMEGVIEECGHDSKDDGENGSLFNTMTSNVNARRGRAVSADQSEYGTEDDEMPFATASVEDAPHLVKSDSLKGKMYSSSTVISDMNHVRKLTKTPPETIQIKYREAIACYIKSLQMLKGAVNASQRILAELNSIGILTTSNETETISQFKRRCETSHRWLGGQFKGVLERAEAAKAEISKFSLNESTSSNKQVNCDGIESESKAAVVVKNVEELIYNHSLTCGKDGAVKQLLGQYEAARSCYRSAGLLIETLLMEPKLVDQDKKSLETYVQGFAERINELDHIMLYQSQRHSSMITCSSGATKKASISSIVPIVCESSTGRHVVD